MQKLTKLCFVILICFTNQLFSQNINTTIPNAVNTVFQNLDKTKIPHNILLDYGYDFIDVTAYNGQLNTNNYLSISKHKSLYNALVSAVTATGVNGIEQPIQEYTEWENLQKQYSKEGTITNSANVILAGLFFDYSKINELALSNNKITVANNKYYDKYINGIWQNPYESKMAFAITAPVLTLNRGLVKVKLPQTLWHTNKQIRNISIYMGSGRPVYQNLNNEAVAYFDYQTTGTYTWTYRVEYAGGTFAYAHQKVIIKSLEGSSNYISRNANCGNLDIVNIIATKPYLNQLGTATLQIAYGSDDCKIRKPLIVAEGFDTGLLAQAGSIGDSDYENFKNSLFDSNSTNLKNLTINDTTEDYDIIYVNWDNGTDYLQRNAYVLEAVIKYVNEQKTINGSTTQNVVLGQSMGGVIARYALKDMENDNTLNHDTRLYISHDAPHKGAHIPIGLLYMARHIVREFIQTPLNQTIVPLITDGDLGLGTISALLGQPALQQMLINNVNVSGQKDNTVHNAWQNELQQMGYPSLTRNIALSNGSHCASTFGLVSNQTLLDINGEIKSTGIAELLLPFLGLSSLPGLALGDLEIILLGNLPGSTKLDIDFKVRTFANYGTGEVYHGNVRFSQSTHAAAV